MALEIRHDMDGNRFVARTPHGEATLSYARVDEDTLDYRSTFVPVEDRNTGTGEQLVLHALEWAEENGFDVKPSCPFVRHVLLRNPDRVPVPSTH